jgi:hypothetical protein
MFGTRKMGKGNEISISKEGEIWNTNMAIMPMRLTIRILTWMILSPLEHDSLPT